MTTPSITKARDHPGHGKSGIQMIMWWQAARTQAVSEALPSYATYRSSPHKNGYVSRHIAVQWPRVRVPWSAWRHDQSSVVERRRSMPAGQAPGAWPLCLAAGRRWRRDAALGTAIDAARRATLLKVEIVKNILFYCR